MIRCDKRQRIVRKTFQEKMGDVELRLIVQKLEFKTKRCNLYNN